MAGKIIDLIKSVDRLSYSYEVTPDVDVEELDNLDFEPIFFSITWHAHQYNCKNLEIAPLRLANYLKTKKKHVLLHITCTRLRTDFLDDLLMELKQLDICNLFIITGENFIPSESDFKSSTELIAYIKYRYGEYFCIGSAGFPGDDDKLLLLKGKVDAGVDFLITQAFFDDSIYKTFTEKCTAMNIHIPILPGIFPFDSPKELQTFLNLCKIHFTSDLTDLIHFKPGNEIILNLIKNLKCKTNVKHFHFFTLNKFQRTSKIVKEMNEDGS